MSHTLQIVYGGTTVSLTATNKYLLDYIPTEGRGQQVVTETVDLHLTGTAITDVQTTVQSIQRALEAAERRYDTGRGDRVFLKFQPDGFAALYRSEITRPGPGLPAGEIELPTKILGGVWAAKAIKTALVLTRVNFWEADSEESLSISNGGGSGTTGIACYNFHGAAVFSGITVSFAASHRILDSGFGFGIFAAGDVISLRGSTDNDGIYTVDAVGPANAYIDVHETVTNEAAGDSISIYDIQNYVHIAAAAIAGDLPAPTRIEITNDNAAPAIETIWIGQNVLGSPDEWPHILEAEDSDTGSNSADATCSSGKKRSYTITTTEAKVTGWTIESATLTSAFGGYFKVLARFAAGTNVTDVKWRIKILYSGTVIWEGPQILFSDTYTAIARLIREIDTVQLPPFIPENSASVDLTFELWGQSNSGGSEAVDLDCLVLLPLDGFRRLRSKDGIVQTSIAKDDAVTRTYFQETANGQVRDISVAGEPIMLRPNEMNRLYILLHTMTANTAEYNRTISVKVYYRPRRVTL